MVQGSRMTLVMTFSRREKGGLAHSSLSCPAHKLSQLNVKAFCSLSMKTGCRELSLDAKRSRTMLSFGTPKSFKTWSLMCGASW